jgi:hypothetical protein
MRLRCKGTSSKAFEEYGALGVAICREWDSFENFREWAIRSGYRDGLTIDRRDSSGNYEPSNCRWASLVSQAQNKRKTRRFATSRYKGVSLHPHTKRWVAKICVSGTDRRLGAFDDERDAAEAYDAAAREHFGEFACVNFPRPGESPALPVEAADEPGLRMPRRAEP